MKIKLFRSSDHSLVAEVVFKGGELNGTGSVKKVADGTNSDVKTIRDAILKFKYFSGVFVYTPRGHVSIWRGFWGWLVGLRLVLPTIGYELSGDSIDWP